MSKNIKQMQLLFILFHIICAKLTYTSNPNFLFITYLFWDCHNLIKVYVMGKSKMLIIKEKN